MTAVVIDGNTGSFWVNYSGRFWGFAGAGDYTICGSAENDSSALPHNQVHRVDMPQAVDAVGDGGAVILADIIPAKQTVLPGGFLRSGQAEVFGIFMSSIRLRFRG